MRLLFRWIAKVISSAMTIVLVIVLLPHGARLIGHIMPDERGAAIKASAIIAARMEESARLETYRVEDEGVLNYDIRAAIIGTVANINVRYKYAGSFGIDLSKVQMQIADNELVFRLPAPEVIQDALTPMESYRDDFWYPGFSDDDYAALLEAERLSCREAHLTGDNGQQLVNVSQRMLESTITAWIQAANTDVKTRFEQLESE
jgi:hypothetical protein